MNFRKKLHLDLLQELIRIDSVNPSLADGANGEKELAHFIGNYLEKIGLEVQYQEIADNRTNVIGILKGSGGGKSIILNGHLDTVGVENMSDPFDPKFKDGRVYGRGAIDMKSGIVSCIMAVQSLINDKVQLRGDIILGFVCDEEYASLGTEKLLEEYSADAAIITEPTDMQICIAHKGFAWIKVEVQGRAAHGSAVDEGIDAIVKAAKVLNGIDNLQQTVYPNITHPLLGSPSIHASLISGGLGLSTYPDSCEIKIERRTLPHENKESVEKEIKMLLDDISKDDPEFEATFDVFFYRPALEIAEDHPIVILLSNSYEDTQNVKPDLVGVTWWMDSALFADKSIPTVVLGPKGEGLHAAIEYVELEPVIQTTEIITSFVSKFCS